MGINTILTFLTECFTKSENYDNQSKQSLSDMVNQSLNDESVEGMVVFTLRNGNINYLAGDFANTQPVAKILGFLYAATSVGDIVEDLLTHGNYSGDRQAFMQAFNTESGYGGVITPDDAFMAMCERGIKT